MNIVVTCGPAYAPIDGARRITNFSTGRLGIALANALQSAGHRVLCLKGDGATCPDPLHTKTDRFTTNGHLAELLLRLSLEADIHAVFHAAALCDFEVEAVANDRGETISSPKFSTRGGKLYLTLVPAMKVLPKLRGWFPRARLFGWKYELAGTTEEAFAAARRQIGECGLDGCILNGAAYGPGFAHCRPDRSITACPDLPALTRHLVEELALTPAAPIPPVANQAAGGGGAGGM